MFDVHVHDLSETGFTIFDLKYQGCYELTQLQAFALNT